MSNNCGELDYDVVCDNGSLSLSVSNNDEENDHIIHFSCPEGCQIIDENGNVLFELAMGNDILVRKKPGRTQAN